MNTSQQTQPTLTIHARRGPLVGTLIVCLIVLALIGDVVLSVLQAPYGIGTDIVFGLLLLLCLVYLCGFAWSALALLFSGQPSLVADADGLTLRHLPFLPEFTLAWSEIKSIHTYRYLFLSYLCIVPQDINQLLHHASLWQFALNASTRFSLRTSAPLNISQNLFDRPAYDLVQELHKVYGLPLSEDLLKKHEEDQAE